MPGNQSSEDKELYAILLRLEELETLLEELDENVEASNAVELPVELKARLHELGLSNVDDVRRHIARLQVSLDDCI